MLFELERFLEGGNAFGPFTLLKINRSDVQICGSVTGLQFGDTPEGFQRLLIVAEAEICRAQRVPVEPVIGAKLGGLHVGADRFWSLAKGAVGVTQPAVAVVALGR